MKVLLFSPEFPPMIGGGGSYNYYLAKSLSKNGIEVLVLTSGGNDCIEKEGDLKIIRRISIMDLYYGKSSYLRPIEDFLAIYKKFKPEVVHSFHSDATLISLIARNDLKFSLVFTSHKTPEKTGIKRRFGAKWMIYDFIFNQQVDRIVAPSIFFKKEALKYPNSRHITNLIYPGVDDDIFYPHPKKRVENIRNFLKIKEGEKLILCPAKLRIRKGLDYLIGACGRIKQRTKIHLLITGDVCAPNEIKMASRLKKMAKKLNVELTIKSFNFQDMPILFSAADLSILPSSHEGLGMALLESMACGTPVIGTDVDGINEVIKDKFNGILVEYGDIKKMAEAINYCLSNDNFRTKIINNGYKTIQEKFNMDKWADAHVKIYNNLIKN